jgi:hypothetical protein
MIAGTKGHGEDARELVGRFERIPLADEHENVGARP